VEVAFAAGYGIDTTDHDEELAAEAAVLAGRAEVVVAFLGLPAADESEGFDRSHMDLPANQTALLSRLADANANLAVVLANGSVVRIAGWEQHARAVLECWLSGQAAGGAAADLLLGAANPSGRLAETLPLRLEDTPSYLNFPGEAGHVRYGEGIFVGYRGYDKLDRDVSYPFGHGLSYTSFEYADLTTNLTGRHQDGDLVVNLTCRVTNTGDRRGKDVVQLYVGDPQASVARPTRELKAFAKVELDPGETTAVHFVLTPRDLSYWSTVQNDWVLDGGEFELAVGASAAGQARRHVHPPGMARRPHRLHPAAQGGRGRRNRQTQRDPWQRGTHGRHRQLPDQHPGRLPRLRSHPLDGPHARRPGLAL
jgi:beta-glucosidase